MIVVEESKSEETSMASDSAYIQPVALVERVDIEPWEKDTRQQTPSFY